MITLAGSLPKYKYTLDNKAKTAALVAFPAAKLFVDPILSFAINIS
jgi:hypothetical protein